MCTSDFYEGKTGVAPTTSIMMGGRCGWVLTTKDPTGVYCKVQTWAAKSASWYTNDPMFGAKIWYVSGQIFKFFP